MIQSGTACLHNQWAGTMTKSKQTPSAVDPNIFSDQGFSYFEYKTLFISKLEKVCHPAAIVFICTVWVGVILVLFGRPYQYLIAIGWNPNYDLWYQYYLLFSKYVHLCFVDKLELDFQLSGSPCYLQLYGMSRSYYITMCRFVPSRHNNRSQLALLFRGKTVIAM